MWMMMWSEMVSISDSLLPSPHLVYTVLHLVATSFNAMLMSRPKLRSKLMLATVRLKLGLQSRFRWNRLSWYGHGYGCGYGYGYRYGYRYGYGYEYGHGYRHGYGYGYGYGYRHGYGYGHVGMGMGMGMSMG